MIKNQFYKWILGCLYEIIFCSADICSKSIFWHAPFIIFVWKIAGYPAILQKKQKKRVPNRKKRQRDFQRNLPFAGLLPKKLNKVRAKSKKKGKGFPKKFYFKKKKCQITKQWQRVLQRNGHIVGKI